MMTAMRRAVLAVIFFTATLASPAAGELQVVSPSITIAEVDPDQAGADRWEFVELAGPPRTPLDGFRLVFFSGGSAEYPAYRVVRLDGEIIGPRGRFVVGSALVDAVDRIAWESNGIQNGGGAPDAIALYRDDAAPRSPTPASLVDVVVYGDRDDLAFRQRFQPIGPPPLHRLDTATTALGRAPDGIWRADWPPSPGFANAPVRLSEVGQAGEIELTGTRGTALAGFSVAVFGGDGELLAAYPLSGTLPSGGPFPGGLLLPTDPTILPPPGGSRIIAIVSNSAVLRIEPVEVHDAFALGTGDFPAQGRLALPALPIPGGGRTVGRWAGGGGSGAAVGPTAPALGGPNFPPELTALTVGAARGAIRGPDSCARPPHWIGRRVRLAGIVTSLLRDGEELSAVLQDDGDGDSRSPDGIVLGSVAAGSVAIGDRLVVTGIVSWKEDQTILDEVTVERREPGAPLPSPIRLPWRIDRCDWARLDGMRVELPEPATVSAPRVILGSRHSFVDVVLGSPASGDPLEYRAFRSDVPVGIPHSALVRLTGQALRAADAAAVLPPARVLDRLAPIVAGVATVLNGRPVVAVDALPAIEPGVWPEAGSVPPDAALRVATFNLRNYFDRWDDPADGGDDPGAPFIPVSVSAYRDRLFATADIVINRLGAPDVLVAQEAEDQDLCHDGGQVFGRCGAVDNADGQLDVLHDLSLAIGHRSAGALDYRPAADRSGADVRGIVTGILYRADRLSPLTGADGKPQAQHAPADPGVAADGDGALLFSRPPLVTRFTTSRGERLTVIGVHFKSDPTDFRPRRDAQAAFAVELVRRELATDPVALVAVAGDFNAPASALPALRSALPRGSLSVAMDQVPAVLRYSYVFDGIAQPIDQILVSPALAARLLDARAIHLNADLPDPAPGEAGVPTRISDHDPVVASFGETASYRVFVPRVP